MPPIFPAPSTPGPGEFSPQYEQRPVCAMFASIPLVPTIMGRKESKFPRQLEYLLKPIPIKRIFNKGQKY